MKIKKWGEAGVHQCCTAGKARNGGYTPKTSARYILTLKMVK